MAAPVVRQAPPTQAGARTRAPGAVGRHLPVSELAARNRRPRCGRRTHSAWRPVQPASAVWRSVHGRDAQSTR